MKNNRFWLLSLVALTIIGVASRWPVGIAIAVILNSLLVLWYVGHEFWRLMKHG